MNEYMYRKELLDWSCEEAAKIEEFFKKTQFKNLSGQEYEIDFIFKIISNEALQNDDARTYRYLYHGTKEANVDGILRDGFLDAKTNSGCCGYGGTYFTSVSSVACDYGKKVFNSGHSLRRRKIESCIFICEILDCEVKDVEVEHNCDNKIRVREHPAERFPGECSMELNNFNDFDEDELKTKMIQLYMHKEEIELICWRFDKYMISQEYIKPKYLLYAYTYEQNVEFLDNRLLFGDEF